MQAKDCACDTVTRLGIRFKHAILVNNRYGTCGILQIIGGIASALVYISDGGLARIAIGEIIVHVLAIERLKRRDVGRLEAIP